MTQQTSVLTHDIEEDAPFSSRMLIFLLKHPFQDTTDLGLAMNASAATVKRHVSRLAQQALIEQIQGGAARTHLAYLTNPGLLQIANLVGADPAKLARMWDVDEAGLLRLLPRLPVLRRIQTVINSLVEYTPVVLSEDGKYGHWRWHWQQGYQHQFVRSRKTIKVLLDAVLVLRQSNTEMYITFLILVDPGWNGPLDLRLMRSRLKALYLWRESAERGRVYSAFPPVLILAQSPRNLECWQWCVREQASALRLAPLLGAILAFSDERQVVSVWNREWQDLSQRLAVRLKQLVRPRLRAEVIPELLAPRSAPPGTFTGEPEHATRKVIRGGFESRARASQPGQPHHPRFLSLRLSTQHRNILQCLFAHPGLSASQVAMILDLNTATVERYVRTLKAEGCITSLDHQRLMLAPVAREYLSRWLSCPPSHVTHRRVSLSGNVLMIQRGLPVPRLLRHASEITRFFCRLLRLSRASDGRSVLIWWESGARCLRRYRYSGRSYGLVPDAIFAYQVGSVRRYAFFEWDEGTMQSDELLRKMQSYERYLRAAGWRAEYQTMPALVMVMADAAGEKLMVRTVKSHLRASGLEVYITMQDLLKRYSPFSAIWLHVNQAGLSPKRVGLLGQKTQNIHKM
jgi:DNA-binding MarR family transcriptional regulator